MGQKINVGEPMIVRDPKEVKKKYPVWKINDIYQDQLRELFEITHPQLINSSAFKKLQDKFLEEGKNVGNWIYFPWSGQLIRMVGEEDYYKLRTNRNRNLITDKEQKKIKDFTVGVAGLSIGASIAQGLAYQGVGNSMKLADFDDLETTNLNRVKAGIHQIGLPKIQIISQQIYEINPYANLKLYPKGLMKKDLDDFVKGKPKPKLIFEIIDDFEMKIRLRIKARLAKVPVIMFSNLGDSILVDIERYDLDPKLSLFNGVIGNLPEEILKAPKQDANKYAVKLVGVENVPKRVLESVKEIGKSLVGRPQLVSTVTISSGMAAYYARLVALGQFLPSDRKLIKFEDAF